MCCTSPSRSRVSSGKPKASDYDDIVKHRLLKAMSIYETYIYTTYAYPLQEDQISWVHDAWEWAGENAEKQYDLTPHMERLVRFCFLWIVVSHK